MVSRPLDPRYLLPGGPDSRIQSCKSRRLLQAIRRALCVGSRTLYSQPNQVEVPSPDCSLHAKLLNGCPWLLKALNCGDLEDACRRRTKGAARVCRRLLTTK